MEEFFQYDQSPRNFFWVEEQTFPATQSDFLRYEEGSAGCFGSEDLAVKNNHGNVNESIWVEEESFPANQSGFVRYEEGPTGGFGSEELAVKSSHLNLSERIWVEEKDFPANHGNVSKRIWVEEQGFPVNQSSFVRYEKPGAGGFGGEDLAVKSIHGNLNKRIWVEEEGFPANQSSFVRYEKGTGGGCGGEDLSGKSSGGNPVAVGNEFERERGRRHMMSERMRREKQKQSYSSLRALLPPGTKNDKNSIVQVAVKEVREMERYREELERRNREMEGVLAGRERGKKCAEGTKIRLRVDNPSSGIDSMVEVVRCLKKMGSKTRAIHSLFSFQEFSAVFEIESQKEAAEVEKAVQKTLFEVERKFLSHFPN